MNSITKWWVALPKVVKISICALGGVGVTSVIVFPTLAATIWKKNVVDGYRIDWNKTEFTLKIRPNAGGTMTATLHDAIDSGNFQRVAFFKSDATEGTLCGETTNDKIYFDAKEYSGTSKVGGLWTLFIYSSKPIIFEDNDRGSNDKGFFEKSNNNETLDFYISNVDTSLVTDMSKTFYNCGFYYRREDYSLDLTSFDTRNVTKMKDMFNAGNDSALAKLLTITIDPNIFKVDKVLGASGDKGIDMFKYQSSLIGGSDTHCDGINNIDAKFAHIDGGTTNPGYFSAKSSK